MHDVLNAKFNHDIEIFCFIHKPRIINFICKTIHISIFYIFIEVHTFNLYSIYSLIIYIILNMKILYIFIYLYMNMCVHTYSQITFQCHIKMKNLIIVFSMEV